LPEELCPSTDTSDAPSEACSRVFSLKMLEQPQHIRGSQHLSGSPELLLGRLGDRDVSPCRPARLVQEPRMTGRRAMSADSRQGRDRRPQSPARRVAAPSMLLAHSSSFGRRCSSGRRSSGLRARKACGAFGMSRATNRLTGGHRSARMAVVGGKSIRGWAVWRVRGWVQVLPGCVLTGVLALEPLR
jgi:hypothetical protein